MVEFYTDVSRHKADILVSGYRDGVRFREKVKFQPQFYIPSNTPTGWTTLDGKHVGVIQPGNIWECNAFIKKYEGVDNFIVYGNTDYCAQYISDNWCDGISPDHSLVKVHSVDIECVAEGAFPHPSMAANPIQAITIHDTNNNIIYTWGLPPDKKSRYVPEANNIVYVECGSENDLLHLFLSHWKLHTPDIITGYNSKLFDMPYIINRIAKVLGDEYAAMISPWGLLIPREAEFSGRVSPYYDVVGVQQLDFMDLFKKFGYEYGTQESYKLDFIAGVVLDDKKVEYDGSLIDLYRNDYQKFISYNIKDTVLVSRMEAKTNLISLARSVAYDSLINFSQVYGPVKMWDCIIYNELRRRKIVVPPEKFNSASGGIQGAYVKDPVPGAYEWVTSVDAASLYPHLILMYNMSPETIINKSIPGVTVDNLLRKEVPDIPEGTCMSATGQLFRTDKKGIFSSLIEKIYDGRVLAKKQMIEAKRELELIEAELNRRSKLC